MEIFAKENPDLVLLDHWLPGINGDEVLQKIKEDNPETPVIIMTAQGSIELAVNLMKMGAFDFLVKPFDLEQIETLVQKGLERTRLKKKWNGCGPSTGKGSVREGSSAVSQKMKEVLCNWRKNWPRALTPRF